MRPFLPAALIAILAAVSISACSSSSNSSTNSTDTNAATSSAADNSAAAPADNTAAAPADNSAAAATVYPGATADTPPGATGTPPPGVAGYSTADPVAKVMAWYKDNLKGAKSVSTSAQGGVFLVGDQKTGTAYMIQAMNGKTWIVSGPAGSLNK